MTADEVIAAFQLPAGCLVDQRVAKKLLVEHGAPTPADRRRINDGVEDVYWVATVKPTTVGVPAFRDETREYLEISVLSASLRDDADVSRIVELIHRAIPYPVILVATQSGEIELSLAHKRMSHGAAGATVLDGNVVAARSRTQASEPLEQTFVSALSISRQPRADIYVLYDGWMNTVVALLAARLTGSFTQAVTLDHAMARRAALLECARLDGEIGRLRFAAAKERQISRQVELNRQLKLAEQNRFAASQNL